MCGAVGHGGGWGYSAHSVEAIRFCADADTLLGGLGLFGGRGEYTAKIKVTLLMKRRVILLTRVFTASNSPALQQNWRRYK